MHHPNPGTLWGAAVWQFLTLVGDVSVELQHAGIGVELVQTLIGQLQLCVMRQRPYNPGAAQTEDKDHRSVLKAPATGTEVMQEGRVLVSSNISCF